jgi:hypothetical protein
MATAREIIAAVQTMTATRPEAGPEESIEVFMGIIKA